MNVDELLRILGERRITLWVDGKALHFRGEAGVLDSELLSELRRNKKDLIAKLLEEQNSPPTKSIEGEYCSLSLGQQALYYLHVAHPQSAAYNVASAARICSPIELDAMRESFRALIARHDALRTTFEIRHGQPWAHVHPHGELDFEQRMVPEGNEDELEAEIRREYQRPFDLARGPLLRVRVWTQSPAKHVFLMTLHHIIFDAWSLWLIQDEFRQLYRQYTGGSPALFPTLDQRYQTFAEDQNALRTSEQGEKLWTYWRERLAGELSPTDLRFDRPRRIGAELQGDTHHFRISKDLSSRLRALGRSQGATPFVVLLAIFKVLLSRYTGQTDQIVGTSTWGRSNPKYRRVVGYFVNTVPIRSDTSGDPTFSQFLGHIKTRTLEALEHQDFPFPLLVDRLNPRRESGQSPICNVMFGVQKPQQFSEVMRLFDEDAEAIDWGGLEVHPFQLNQQEGQFDLTMDLFETTDSFWGALKYDPELFDRETVERMARHFVHLAEGIAQDPSRAITDYDLSPAEERFAIQAFCESGPRVAVSNERVHRLFEQQAARSPRQIALVCGRLALTYEEVNHRANQAACLLREESVKQGTLVACRLERGLDSAVWLLAIWKAGGVYLPLDAADPHARCAQILENSRAELLITQSSLDWNSGQNSSAGSHRTLLLDELSDRLSQYAGDEFDGGNLPAKFGVYPAHLRFHRHPEGGLRFACGLGGASAFDPRGLSAQTGRPGAALP